MIAALWMAAFGCTGPKEAPCAEGFVSVDGRCEPVSDSPKVDTGSSGPDDTGEEEDTGGPDFPDNADLVSGERIECSDPSLRSEQPFESPRGLTGEITESSPWDPIAAGGFAIADFDADGRLDLFLPQVSSDQLYMDFLSADSEDSASTRLPEGLDLPSAGGNAVDIEGDGDVDLFVPRPGGDHLLLLNDGTGHFEDATEALGLDRQGWPAVGAVFADGDGDGDLDMLVNTYRSCDPSMGPLPENSYTDAPQAMWQQNADGTFEDISDQIPDHPAGRSRLRAALWTDSDLDGDPDVYTVSDRGYISECMVNNQFFRNEGGIYTDDSEATSLGLQMEGMGIGYGDINQDGWPDFAMSDMQRVWLMESDGAGGWYDATFVRDLAFDSSSDDRWSGWGTELADIDNDGDLDLFVGFGGLPDAPSGEMNPWAQPDEMWLQQSDGSFETVADAWGLASEASTRAAHMTDLNGDGWLDLITREIAGSVAIHMARCGASNWLSVALQEPGGNREAIGAKVELITESASQVRWVTQGTRGLQSSVPTSVHFGLEGEETVDLTVTWTDGETSIFRDLSTNRHLRIQRIP